jgi:hypothetical protein
LGFGVLAASTACGATGAADHASGPTAVAAPPAAVLPPDFKLGFLVETPATRVRVRVNAAGRPYVLTGATFASLRTPQAPLAPPPFSVRGVGEIGDAVWTDDGALLVIEGRRLGVVTPEGFSPIGDLPSARMRLAPAGDGKCWLFGGDGGFERSLTLYDKGGGVRRVLELPTAISAVSGTPERAYVTTGGSILRLQGASAPSLVFDGADRVQALARAGEGVFFSTPRGVFYLADSGLLVPMMRDPASDVQIHGEDLFLVLDGKGVALGTPISRFDELGRRKDP